MVTRVFPRKPYDEVQSEFVRDEIRRGSFDDIEYRRYVNELVWLEWYTRDRTSVGAISSFAADLHRYRLAARIPDAYDAVRESLDATTRADISFSGGGDADPARRQSLSQEHARQWAAAARGDRRDRSTADQLGRHGRRRPFARFRFPVLAYDTVQSEFVRDEIRRGSFDDLEHRRAVNQLVWLEWYATGGDTAPGSFGSAVTNWRLAAVHLDAFDIVRREFGAPTRDSIRLEGELACSVDTPLDERTSELERAWQAV
jgi:hypothetical protein